MRGLEVHDNGHVTLFDRIDGVLLHPVVGVIVFLAVLFTVFQATTTLASPMQDWIDVTFRGWCASGLDWLLGLFGVADHGGWMRSLLAGVVLRHTMFRGLGPEPLMLALPAYQCPRALQLVRSVLLRLWGFVRGASVIIISMIVALWLLQGIPMTAGAGVFMFRAMMWCAGAELLRLAPVAMETAMRGEDPMIAGASVTTLLLVLVAGVAAGFVGYAVGASSLVSYPALLAFGIPPVLSNTTNTVGVCGTGIGGLLSARKELTGQGGRVAVYACIGLVGGVIGGLLLLELPAKVFEFAVPPLILFSALIIAFNPRRKAVARDRFPPWVERDDERTEQDQRRHRELKDLRGQFKQQQAADDAADQTYAGIDGHTPALARELLAGGEQSADAGATHAHRVRGVGQHGRNTERQQRRIGDQ